MIKEPRDNLGAHHVFKLRKHAKGDEGISLADSSTLAQDEAIVIDSGDLAKRLPRQVLGRFHVGLP